MPKETTTAALRVGLDTGRQLELGAELAQLNVEIADLEQEKAAAYADYASRLKQLAAQRDRLSRALRDGYEVREVGVEVTLDYERNTRTEVRVDTGEVIGERPLVADDRRADAGR